MTWLIEILKDIFNSHPDFTKAFSLIVFILFAIFTIYDMYSCLGKYNKAVEEAKERHKEDEKGFKRRCRSDLIFYIVLAAIRFIIFSTFSAISLLYIDILSK